MLIFTKSLRVCRAVSPCDPRASFEKLAVVVKERLGKDERSSQIFGFTNRRRHFGHHHLSGLGTRRITKRFEQGRTHHTWPFCHFELQARQNTRIINGLCAMMPPQNERSLGQHLRYRRAELEVTQKEAARQCGTTREVFDRWERDEMTRTVSFWPRIIAFLGEYPFAVRDAAERALQRRREGGLSQFAFGRTLGVSIATVRRIEGGVRR